MFHTLVSDLNKLCDEHPFHSGWYLQALRTGETAHRHGHVSVPSASTRKIAIMMATLQAVHQGKLALDQPVAIQAKYQNNELGRSNCPVILAGAVLCQAPQEQAFLLPSVALYPSTALY